MRHDAAPGTARPVPGAGCRNLWLALVLISVRQVLGSRGRLVGRPTRFLPDPENEEVMRGNGWQ